MHVMDWIYVNRNLLVLKNNISILNMCINWIRIIYAFRFVSVSKRYSNWFIYTAGNVIRTPIKDIPKNEADTSSAPLRIFFVSLDRQESERGRCEGKRVGVQYAIEVIAAFRFLYIEYEHSHSHTLTHTYAHM